MPNRTAIPTGFTRPLPVLISAAVHSKASRSVLLSVLVLAASGCSDSPTAPSPQRPSPAATLTTVTLEGRVLDEQDQPVDGARITLTYIHPLGPVGGTAPSVTADDTGAFSLNLELPADWHGVTLRVDREGYESNTRIFFGRPLQETPRALVITLYRSLTIRPGESTQMTVSLNSVTCSIVEDPCRRVMVDAPSGQLVDLEVVPVDGQNEVRLQRIQNASEVGWPRQLTVTGGDEVWVVVGAFGRVTLRAVGR